MSITSSLIAELINKKVKIIFTNEKHNPIGEIVPYHNNYYSFRKIKEQIAIPDERKKYAWKSIITAKILNQARNLKDIFKEKQYEMLTVYAKNVENDDETNREGQSAKVYFNSLFGKDFNRD